MSRTAAGPRTRLLLSGLLAGLLTVALGMVGLAAPAEAARKASISGTVTDSAGAPLRGIVVDVARWNEEFGAWESVTEESSKGNGTYSAKNLPPGDYQVRFFDRDEVYVDELWDDKHLDDEANGAAVGAGGSAYTPTAADVGKTVSVEVTASKTGFDDGTATSAPVGPVTSAGTPRTPGTPGARGTSGTPGTPGTPAVKIANAKLPRIKGDLEVGEKVRVTAGRWTPAAVTLSYRWFAGGEKIRKATQRTFTITAEQAGLRLKVKVTAKAAGYASATVRTSHRARVKA